MPNKKQVLVRPRNRFILPKNDDAIAIQPLIAETSEQIVTSSNAPITENTEVIVDEVLSNTSEVEQVVAYSNNSNVSTDMQEKPLDLTDIGTEIVNNESLNSEVCYAENCGRSDTN